MKLDIIIPEITVFAGYANTLTILLQYPEGYHWYLQNYFHLLSVYNSKTNTIATEFYNIDEIKIAQKYNFEAKNILSRPIETFTIPSELIQESGNSIVDTFKFILDHGIYLSVYIDRKLVKKHSQSSQINHSTFIFGYDSELKAFWVLDYFGGNAYSKEVIPFEEIESAFISNDGLILDDGVCYEFEEHNLVSLMRYNTNFKYKFKISKFMKDINVYKEALTFRNHVTDLKIHNTNTEEVDYYYGIDVCRAIANYIFLKIESGDLVDGRQLCILRDQKIALRDKLCYLEKEYGIKESTFVDLQSLIVRYNILINKQLKHNMRPYKNNKLAQQFLIEINSLLEIELRILDDLAQLSKN